MGELQETIKDKVASYHEDMIEYWKDLVNYQAGSRTHHRPPTKGGGPFHQGRLYGDNA